MRVSPLALRATYARTFEVPPAATKIRDISHKIGGPTWAPRY